MNGAVASLAEILDELLETNTTEILEEVNKVFATPEYLHLLIQIIKQDPGLFEKMRRESYYHENGFHKIVLLSGRNFKLRLHHFGASAKAPMENIHDHRWAFSSSILDGSLEMDLFEASAGGEGAEKLFHFIYDSDKQTGSYNTHLKGFANIRKAATRIYNAGESYLMLPHELHRIKNQPGEESITLILTGKPKSKRCNLYARRKILDQEKITTAYSAASLNSMLDQIIETIFPKKN